MRLVTVTTIRGDQRSFNPERVLILSPVYAKTESAEWLGTRCQLGQNTWFDTPLTHDALVNLIDEALLLI